VQHVSCLHLAISYYNECIRKNNPNEAIELTERLCLWK